MNDTAESDQYNTAVLIVGGGPVGLGLAMELAYRRIPCVLVDKTDGIVRMSKMGLLSVRTMEYCRRWGIADQVRACGFPADYPLNQVFCTSLNGHHIATIEYPCIADEPTHGLSPEKKQRCPQLWFDPILARNVREQPTVDVRYEQEMLSFEQDADGVTATLRDLKTGSTYSLRARYMVGCDGAGSTVRNALGFHLEGDAALSYSVGIYFNAPDLIRYHKMGPAERYMVVGEDGTWGHLTVVDSKDIWRLTVLGSQERVESESFDADHWLRRCLGRDDIPYEITAVLPWRRSRLVANRFYDKRVFLAGDACHVMAPNGGYGMNTGLGDAVDLGWKLAAVLEGWAPPALLDSYERERRPVAWRNVNAAASNFSSLAPKLSFTDVESDTPEGAAARARMESELVEGTRPEWEAHGINLGYRYDDSPVIYDDGTAHTPDDMSVYVPTSRPGHRAPHVALPDGRSTIDLFGPGFVLLEVQGGATTQLESIDVAAMTRSAGDIPVQCYRLTGDEAVAAFERRYTLVRPDGHVAWRAETLPDQPAAIWQMVTGRQGVATETAEHAVATGA